MKTMYNLDILGGNRNNQYLGTLTHHLHQKTGQKVKKETVALYDALD